jgi:hypothetical protein
MYIMIVFLYYTSVQALLCAVDTPDFYIIYCLDTCLVIFDSLFYYLYYRIDILCLAPLQWDKAICTQVKNNIWSLWHESSRTSWQPYTGPAA